MQLFRSARWFLLALLLSVVPASSFAGVFISVGIAPPALPVYEQPPCPEEGLMWTPGYWAYGEDGYYWVPGAWVPAPYEGALWTPGYWGWSNGMYVFHDGYWGNHVGYYGGVNYGFGYMGIGFVGGLWRDHHFAYNTEVMHVNERFVHSVYHDRDIVNRYTVANDRHVAFSGGPGGIRHDARPEEMMAEHDRHIARTDFQQQHESAARGDHGAYFKTNGGHPQTPAMARPMTNNMHAAPGMHPAQQPQQQSRPGYQPQQQTRPMQPQAQPQQQMRPMQQPQAQPRTAPQAQPQSRPTPQAQPSRPAAQPKAQPQQHAAPKGESKEKNPK
jgi:hypothetical protein